MEGNERIQQELLATEERVVDLTHALATVNRQYEAAMKLATELRMTRSGGDNS